MAWWHFSRKSESKVNFSSEAFMKVQAKMGGTDTGSRVFLMKHFWAHYVTKFHPKF